MIRRTFLKATVASLAVLAVPAVALAKTRELPRAVAQRMAVPLRGNFPIRPGHIADIYAEMERFNHRVAYVFLSPRRLKEVESDFGPDYPPRQDSVEEASLHVWGADIIEVDIADDVIILETDPDAHVVMYSDIEPVDLSKYQR